jgi:enoyl-CoA hydratase/carnithine racemase
MPALAPTASAPLLVETNDSVGRITLNRPDRRNALSENLVDELATALDRLGKDSSVRVIVLGAAGPVFSSGHDLGEMTGRSEAEYRAIFTRCSAMMQKLHAVPQPVIARVQGLATAAGCQLVAACDLAVAATEARFATPGVKIGLFCTTPMVPLVRNIAAKPAMEMLLTGAPITADRALQLGLVNRVVPADQLDAAIQEYIDVIRASSAETIRLGKQAFYAQRTLPESEAYCEAVDVMTENAIQHDAQEGISAFLQKRPAKWRHGQGD